MKHETTSAYDPDWRYTIPIILTKGQHHIDILPEPNVRIKQLIIFSTLTNEESMTIDDLFLKDSINPIVEFKRLEAEKWTVNINTSKPFILAFSETYHSLWRAYTDDREYQHFPLDTQLNGFIINKTGNFEITIEFIMGEAHHYGETISILTLLIVGISYLFLEDKSRIRIFKLFKKIVMEIRKIISGNAF